MEHTATSATLNYSVLGESRADRAFTIYYLTNDVDVTKDLQASGADRFTDSRVELAKGTCPQGATGDLTLDVTEAVNAKAGSQITFILTGNIGGGDLYGNGSSKAPKLTYVESTTPVPTVAPSETETPAETPVVT